MSDFTVIGDIGETLRRLLEDDPWQGILGGRPDITLLSPKEVADEGGGNNRISIFLYHIQVNPFLRNEETVIVSETTIKPPPLTLDLFYLVTPYSDDKTNEKYLIGKVMQIFHDNSQLTGSVLQGGLVGSEESFKLLFSATTLDDLARVWDAFQDVAYRLSVGYMVPAVRIDSAREIEVHRVLTSNHHRMLPRKKR
jgi:hypothetical protein